MYDLLTSQLCCDRRQKSASFYNSQHLKGNIKKKKKKKKKKRAILYFQVTNVKDNYYETLRNLEHGKYNNNG